MKPKLLRTFAALVAVLALAGITANAQIWVGATLGSPSNPGSVSTNTDGTLTIVAGGDDIWNTSDNGYYYYTWAKGDFDARVKVISLDTASSVWAKTEMMVRYSDPASGPQGNDGFLGAMCASAQSPSNQEQYRSKRAQGAANDLAGGVNVALAFPDNWLRVTRTNTTITLWASADGATWTALATPVDTSGTANGFGNPAWPDLVTVGVAVTAHNDAATTTTVVGQPTVTSSGGTWSPPTASGISRDVANASGHVGGEVSFSFIATNNSTPVPLVQDYQWYKNGTAVPGLTGSATTWLAAAGDTGAQFRCVSWPQGYPSISVTSAVGTVTVANDSVAYTNGVKVEVFAGATRGQVEASSTGTGDTGNVSAAGKLVWKPTFEDGGGYGDNTSRRYSAWFIPWADGNYTFYVAGDDDSDVFLSTDANPSNKRMIAQEMTWSAFNNWIYSEDINSAANIDPTNSWRHGQKCSDTWTNGSGVAANPNGIGPLTAGSRYYIEVVEHNGGGGDNLSLTAKLFSDPAPTNGQPSTLTVASNNLVMVSFPMPFTPASFVWSVQPTNNAADENFGVTFYARATSDSEFRPNYQWQQNGVNIAGATATSYNIDKAAGNMNGYQYQLVATLPTLINAASTTVSITSQVATLTVRTAVFEPGFVLNERWNGPNNWPGARDGTLGTPNYVAAIPAFEAAVDNPSGGNMVNYTRRISGLFIPATTGNYVFFVNSDDNSALFISTDANSANKYEICTENGWSNPWQWTTSGDGSGNGGSSVWLKRSDQYTNATAGNFNPVLATPHTITLQANTRYYLEDDNGQGTGGGNAQATFKLASEADPANGADTRFTGNLIGMLAPKANWVKFTLEPTNPPPVAAGAISSATFYADGDSDSKLYVGSTRSVTINGTADELIGQRVFFQWYKNGTAISGATATSLTLTGLRTGDNGAQIQCQMRALGYGQAPNTRFWSNSVIATLTVTNDPTVPQLLAAGAYQNPRDGKYYISLTFNVPIDPFTATNPASYSVSGGATVYNVAWFSPDNRRILLEVSFIPTPPPVTVSITAGLKSWSGVAVAPVSNAAAYELASSLTYRDIGAGDSTTFQITDPLLPSKLWVEGPNAWTIAATGHDIWDANDGFTFLYETKTGDFDVVLRQTAYGTSSPWAKCGLMLREGINGSIDDFTTAGADAGRSRNWVVVNDPKDVAVVGGTGANQVECGQRFASTNVATGDWFPAGGTGGNRIVVYHPQYPNAWVRLKRAGQTITGFAGNDGANWWKVAETTITSNTNNPTPLPDAVFVGVCATAHNNPAGDPATYVNDPQYYNYATVDSYNSSYTGGTIIGAPGAVLSATHQGGNITFNWTFPGTVELQWTTDLNTGTWNAFNPHATVPPVTVPTTAARVFYRIHAY
jgi:hypothetical protein